MIHPGLVSITFRALTPAQIVELVRQAGLRGIEWGGDIHVPHGNVERAREVRERTAEAGLVVAAYGSYYKAGASERTGLPFAHVLESAIELGAPMVRVWAGPSGSADTSPNVRQKVVADLRRIAALAAGAKLGVSLEFHSGTLTDTAQSAVALLDEVGQPNLFSLWQPAIERDTAGGLEDLRRLMPRVTNLHVYHWLTVANRRPLAEGAAPWKEFLKVVVAVPGDRYALLEYVEADSPANFLRDAATLKQWLGAIQPVTPVSASQPA